MLKQVSTHLNVQQPDPDIASHLRVLVKAVLPKISDERLAEIMAIRSYVPPEPLKELLPNELVDEVFTGDDHTMVKEHKWTSYHRISFTKIVSVRIVSFD